MIGSHIEIILYCKNQQLSRDFYAEVLKLKPVLDVPGMTEFQLNDYCKLGLMPEEGIARIIGTTLPHPAKGNGIPRCELYLYVVEVENEYQNALRAGAGQVSLPAERNWGDYVAYVSDPDGHVIAFAQPIKP